MRAARLREPSAKDFARKEPARKVLLPPQFPEAALHGQRGKLIRNIAQLTGTTLHYIPEDHSVDLHGRPQNVDEAARLVERCAEHYQYSGLQFARKDNNCILCPELTEAPGVQLLQCSRPVTTLVGGVDGFVLAPIDADTATEFGLPPGPDRSQQPDASTSGRAPSRLVVPASEFQACFDRLLDLAVTASLQHPADCDRTELRIYIGKLTLADLRSSARMVTPDSLFKWTYPKSGRSIFETSLPQATIISLDKYLTSRGLTATQQAKSASLHLETSVSWIQYHPTFSVTPDGALRLAKLETLGCKPLTMALVGPPDCTDVRMRYVATVQHGADDPVAEALRQREAQFTLAPNGVQINIPDDLHTLDLRLTSARVKLKRVYVSSQPLPPPPCAWPAPPEALSAAAAAPPAAGLPPVRLKVSVAAVLDNNGARRLEVTVACPEVNELLMDIHRRRAAPEGTREALAQRVWSLLAHVQDLRANVAFEP